MAELLSREMFSAYVPIHPSVVNSTKNSIQLSFEQPEAFNLRAAALYTVQTETKLLGWVNVYHGGRSTKVIENLESGIPHKFRLKISIDFSKLSQNKYKEHRIQKVDNSTPSGTKENDVTMVTDPLNTIHEKEINNLSKDDEGNINTEYDIKNIKDSMEMLINKNGTETRFNDLKMNLVESQWSEVMIAFTKSEVPSVVYFCMAVRCGYTKQVQTMVEERPDIVNICNTIDGFTPLAIAVRKGNIPMTRYLLNSGADINQTSSSGQTPLHLSVLSANICLTDILLERGADVNCTDLNGLSPMHYAVDSGDLRIVLHMLRRLDVNVRDNKGWTPLHRAVMQAAPTAIIQELVNHGADLEMLDRNNLSCPQLAALSNRRDDIRRIVDKNFPRDNAFNNFTKLTKKLSIIHTLTNK